MAFASWQNGSVLPTSLKLSVICYLSRFSQRFAGNQNLTKPDMILGPRRCLAGLEASACQLGASTTTYVRPGPAAQNAVVGF